MTTSGLGPALGPLEGLGESFDLDYRQDLILVNQFRGRSTSNADDVQYLVDMDFEDAEDHIEI